MLHEHGDFRIVCRIRASQRSWVTQPDPAWRRDVPGASATVHRWLWIRRHFRSAHSPAHDSLAHVWSRALSIRHMPPIAGQPWSASSLPPYPAGRIAAEESCEGRQGIRIGGLTWWSASSSKPCGRECDAAPRFSECRFRTRVAFAVNGTARLNHICRSRGRMNYRARVNCHLAAVPV